MKKSIYLIVFTALFLIGFGLLFIHNSEKESDWRENQQARFECIRAGLGEECDF